MVAEVPLVWSLLLSAAVAALVTLLIEYAVKPYVETRKERLLRSRRLLWELAENLMAQCTRLDSLSYRTRHEEFVLEAFLEEVKRVAAHQNEVSDLTSKAAYALPGPILAELSFANGRHEEMFGQAEATTRRVIAPPFRQQAYREVFDDAGVGYEMSIAYLMLPGWRRFRRRRLLARAEANERQHEIEFPDVDDED